MARKPEKSVQTTFVPLPGSKRTLAPHSRPLGSIDPSEVASVTVRTRSLGDFASLEQRTKDLYSQPLAKRSYLSREEIAKQHGARKEDFDAIELYAQEHDLAISHRSLSERSIVLTGKLGNLLDAFHADVQMFHHASGTYRGRQGEILIPKQFEHVIQGIFGFDTRPKHKSPHRRRVFAAAAAGQDNGVPATAFAEHYDFPTEYQGAKLDGSGQCIAIIELGGGYKTSDLTTYFKEIGIQRPNTVAVSVDHGGNHPTKTGLDDGEVMLDIEVAGAVAPKAKLAVYFAPNQGSGFIDAINAAVHDSERNPSVISISWGSPEDQITDADLKAYHEIFVEAAAMGITVCAATGDHGTADSDAFHWDNAIHVDHPAADDFVLACGGTQIDDQNRDVVWNDGTPLNEGGWATGGGISRKFGVPDYQKNTKMPTSIVSKKHGRGIPDIAMSATNYLVRVQGSDGVSGGTSAVAPLMASLVVLLNQAKKKNVGFMNPFLYSNAAHGVAKDVTSGTNAIADTVKGYEAGAGWDACTGLGTPSGKKILELL